MNGTFQDTEFEISLDESLNTPTIKYRRHQAKQNWCMEYVFTDGKDGEVASVAAHGAAAHITTSLSWLETGDFVTYEYSGVATEQIVGLDPSNLQSGNNDTEFELNDLDGNAIANYGAVAAFGDGTGAKFHQTA